MAKDKKSQLMTDCVQLHLLQSRDLRKDRGDKRLADRLKRKIDAYELWECEENVTKGPARYSRMLCDDDGNLVFVDFAGLPRQLTLRESFVLFLAMSENGLTHSLSRPPYIKWLTRILAFLPKS